MIMLGELLFVDNPITLACHSRLCKALIKKSKKFFFFKKTILLFALIIIPLNLAASCPSTSPWTAPVQLDNGGNVTSNIFSAANSAGFMAVWADSSNNAHYSFSSDGATWQSGLVSSAMANVASVSDVFVAANASGFLVAWMDNSNNAWSSFSADNGSSWSSAIQINPLSLALNDNSDVYVSGGSSGFVAAMIGSDNNAYVSFSTGTAAWSAPAQVTNDGSVQSVNQNSQTGRGFVTVAVVGNTCMLAWLNNADPTFSAYFSSINPFSSTTPYPIVNIGFLESAAIVAALNGYFMSVVRANVASGQTYFSTATTPTNWATFSSFASNPSNPNAGPWIASNPTGFMCSWTVNGNPIWTLTNNNGFNFTPVCSILDSPSTTIGGPVGLSGNVLGFVATWLDNNDSNPYATFYFTPVSNPPTSNNLFVTLLEQKYGPLL